MSIDKFLLSVFEDINSHKPGTNEPMPSGSNTPISTGFSLGMPIPSYVEMDIVRAYKASRFIRTEAHMQMGWRLCSAANTLKQQIVQYPESVLAARVEEYVGLLAMVREYVHSNATPYVYSGGLLKASDIDFELYMTLSILAARATTQALDERASETANGFHRASLFYARAAEIVEAMYSEICDGSPPPDRIGKHDKVVWQHLVVPRGLSKADTILMIRARAMVLRCESYVCLYKELQIAAKGDEEAFIQTLDSVAEFVACQFNLIARELTARGTLMGSSRIARYAEFMACLYRLHVIAHQAAIDVHQAENTLDVFALGRALRRLDHTGVPRCSQQVLAVVDNELLRQLKEANNSIVLLRGRCDAMVSDTSGVYTNVSLSSPMTEPLAVSPIDPWTLAEDTPTEAMPFSIGALRTQYANAHQEFVAFLALRDQYNELVSLVKNPRDAERIGHGTDRKNMAEAIMAMFAQQLTSPDVANGTLRVFSEGEVLSELVTASFQMGRLAERKAWADFAFILEEVPEDGQGESSAGADVKEVDDAIIMGGAYFADLAGFFNLPPAKK